MCYLKLNKYQEALMDCKKSVEIDPKALKGFYFLGLSFYFLKNYIEAEKAFSKALTLSKELKIQDKLIDKIHNSFYITRKLV